MQESPQDKRILDSTGREFPRKRSLGSLLRSLSRRVRIAIVGVVLFLAGVAGLITHLEKISTFIRGDPPLVAVAVDPISSGSRIGVDILLYNERNSATALTKCTLTLKQQGLPLCSLSRQTYYVSGTIDTEGQIKGFSQSDTGQAVVDKTSYQATQV